MKEVKVFAKGLSFYKLFIIFIIGCLFGNYYEMILNLVRHYLRDGSIFWEVRRGVIYLPLSPIYGFGAVIMTSLLAERKDKWYVTLVKGMIIGGSLEYIISYLQEVFIGTSSWNYSNKILDINGRTTIPIMFLWGILGLLFVRYVYPFISKLIESIPYKEGVIITRVLIVIVSLDMLVSFSAVYRQSNRRDGIKPYTKIGELYDKVYTDERLKRAYPNMKVKRK